MRDERKVGTFIYKQGFYKVIQWANTTKIGGLIIPVSYTHLTLPTNREV